MRVIFIATGDIALPSFRRLIETGRTPVALVTQPDKPVGRHQKLTPPRIKLEAIDAGIPVFQPETIGDAAGELAAFDPDVLVVMAYGQMLWKNIRSLPRMAIVNLHASLLPKYRGAACIQAAIDAGDAETGITAMHVVRQLDAGDIIHARSIAMSPEETGGSLHDRLADLAADVLVETLDQIGQGRDTRTPQDDIASSYVPKLGRDDGRIDWGRSADAIERRIRAYDPWPGTFTTVLENGSAKRLKISPPTRVVDSPLAVGEVECDDGKLRVGCGKNALEIFYLQPEGARRMTAAEYLLARRPQRFD